MSLCPEFDERAAMTDGQFWERVATNLGHPPVDADTDPYEDLSTDPQLTVEPCPICGEAGACAYDAEGRPLIHTDTELPGGDPQ